jgi:hypothetical protein
MVYHPEYFARLDAIVQQQFRRFTGILSAGRQSNPPEQAEALVTGGINGEP